MRERKQLTNQAEHGATPVARRVVTGALALVRDHYIFPDKAAELSAAVGARIDAGAYDDLDDESLASRVTADFQETCADQHLRLLVRPADLHGATTEAEEIAAWNESQRISNYRIAEVRRLDGNIGYIDLRGVTSPDAGGPAIAAAMELVARTEALIFDLRKNRGGDPDGVQMWNSYLFPDSDTHLNDIYDGQTRRTRQFWTLAYVPGRRYLDRPVYLLTSNLTFSAGEEFAYNLQAQRRATLIGQVTRGGAHPTARFPVSATMEVAVPNARSVNPLTGGNWEGTGVVPDVEATVERTFDIAYGMALTHVATTSSVQSVVEEATHTLAGVHGRS
jgi:C-terminal processing protease CtpA/Prc